MSIFLLLNKPDEGSKKSHFIEAFPVPNIDIKKKQKKSKIQTSSVCVVDDILQTLQEKDDEKKKKEQQILEERQKREKARQIKAQEQEIIKKHYETKNKLIEQKKNINAEIKKLKKLKKTDTENKIQLKDKILALLSELKNIENQLLYNQMEFIKTKIQVKEEKV